MLTFKNIEKFVQKSSSEHLRERKPDFWNRYEGQIDKFDFDLDFLGRSDGVFRFFFEQYFRIQVRGAHNIPVEGPVVLAGNHSGTIPIDAVMTFEAALQHPEPRRVRYIILPWFKRIAPIWDTLSKLGCVEASFQNALTLLNDGEIVGIYPEAERAMTKNLKERYQLRTFDPGFVRLAIATQAPIVPVITVGAEETFPNFANWDAMAKFLGLPIFPITLTFPWLPFPLMFAPVPARWLIMFGKPIKLDYPPEKSYDKELTTRLAAEIQEQIQQELNTLVAKRKSVVTGWDDDELDAHEMRSIREELERAFDLASV